MGLSSERHLSFRKGLLTLHIAICSSNHYILQIELITMILYIPLGSEWYRSYTQCIIAYAYRYKLLFLFKYVLELFPFWKKLLGLMSIGIRNQATWSGYFQMIQNRWSYFLFRVLHFPLHFPIISCQYHCPTFCHASPIRRQVALNGKSTYCFN